MKDMVVTKRHLSYCLTQIYNFAKLEAQMAVKERETKQIGFRITLSEEKMVLELAGKLERTVSDTVRYAIRQTAREHGLLSNDKSSLKVKRMVTT